MKGLQRIAFRLLAILIFLGACSGAWISWERYHVEENATRVEMVYDYNHIIDSAAEEGKTPEELFNLYKKSGVTSLAVYDETPEKLINHNYIRVYRGYDFQFRNPDVTGIKTGKIYIQPIENKEGQIYFSEMKHHLHLIYGQDKVREFSAGNVETLEIDGNYSKFMTVPLGIFKETVKKVAAQDFYVVLRPANIPHPSKEFIDSFFEAVDSSDKVSAVLFQGKEALGYKDQLDYVSSEMNRRHLPLVMIEAQNQLGFEPQEGLLDLAKKSDYNLVRLYAMSKDELIKINQKEAASRFYISDIERNIRMNLFPSYKFAAHGLTLSETNASYIQDVKNRLENHGFTVGKASVMSPYFPSPLLRSMAIIGATSLVVLTLLLILPGLKPWILGIEAVGVIGALGLYWLLHLNLVVQLLALGAAVCTPVVVVTLFLNYCIKRKDMAFAQVGWSRLFVESITILWGAGILSLIGAAFVSGLLGDIRYLLEMEIFRGVKATFVLPLVLISLVYIQKFPFFGKTIASDRDFVSFVRKFCHVQIKLGLLVGLGILAIVGFVFIGRSGNNGAPVPQFEIALRRFLEDVMYARPREKEFLFGHPAILVSLAALYRKWPQILHYFLIVAVTIGQGSMVETFAHMRSPYILSLIRGLDGLAAGSLAMVGALLAVMILVRITKFFGERYGKL